MSTRRSPVHADRESPITLRLIIGIPLLCVLISLFSWIEWAVQGFAPELSPHHWLDDHGAVFLGMGFGGGVVVLLATALVWTLGIIALGIGGGCLRVLRHWRGD